MKILHVLQNYYPSYGGTQILFQNISENLVEKYKDEVEVYTTNSMYGPDKIKFKEINPSVQFINNVRITRFSFKRYYYSFFLFIIKFFTKFKLTIPDFMVQHRRGPYSKEMKKAIINSDADIICASSSDFLYMNYPLWKNKNKKPFIFMGAVHFTEDLNYNPILNKTLKAIKQSDFYIANTQYEKDRLISLGVNGEKIKVVGCGVNLKKYESNYQNSIHKKFNLENRKIVGFIGRHEPSKGIITLIKAATLCWENGIDFFLLIAGSTSDFTLKIKKAISKINPKFQENIALISNFSEEDKIEIYKSLNLFVSVSQAESFGIVYLEAWANKIPVIGANIGAVKSVISHNKDGLIVEQENEIELSEAICKLLNDDNLRKDFGTNGYLKVVENYTWDKIVSKYRNIYLEAIKLPIN